MYSRILLKLSGEAMSSKTESFDPSALKELALEIKQLVENKVKVAIVVGGGNFVRGKLLQNLGMKREAADTMGILGTVMNALALESVLKQLNIKAKAFSAVEMPEVMSLFIQEEVETHLEQGYVVIFAGGTGNPYFSTDTGCALRAIQTRSELVLFAKNGVDGVYDQDPSIHKDAKKFKEISYDDIIRLNLNVIDMTAASLLKENKVSAYVFDMKKRGDILKIVEGHEIGTKIIVKE